MLWPRAPGRLQRAFDTTKFMGLVCEIEFIPVYKDQPLFDDVHREMREYGLTIYDLRTHRTYRPFNGRCFSWYRDRKGFARHSFDLNGRLVAGDALYIRDFEDRPPENLAATPISLEEILDLDLSEGIEDDLERADDGPIRFQSMR